MMAVVNLHEDFVMIFNSHHGRFKAGEDNGLEDTMIPKVKNTPCLMLILFLVTSIPVSMAVSFQFQQQLHDLTGSHLDRSRDHASSSRTAMKTNRVTIDHSVSARLPEITTREDASFRRNADCCRDLSLQEKSTLTDYSIVFSEAFKWQDLSAARDNLTIIKGINQIREFSLPFVFRFYDRHVTNIFVTSNGWITFAMNTIVSEIRDELKASTFPLARGDGEYMIAPLFSSYFAHLGGNDSVVTKVAISEKEAIIEYHVKDDLNSENQTTSALFQVVLLVNGTIMFNYRHVESLIVDHFQTIIGLNYGDGVHFNKIDPHSILKKNNVTITFTYPQQGHDMAVRINISSFYGPMINETQFISVTATNLGTSISTDFTLMGYLNDSIILNKTISSRTEVNNTSLAPGESLNIKIPITMTKEVSVNVTVLILNQSDENTRYLDDVMSNNRHQLIMSVMSAEKLPSFRIRAIVANESTPLKDASVHVRDVHGLIMRDGITDSQGFFNITALNINPELWIGTPWTIVINVTHVVWKSAFTKTTLYLNDTFRENGSIISVYLGPGSVHVRAPSLGSSVVRGVLPITVSISPREKITEIGSVILVSNSKFNVSLSELQFQGSENDENASLFILHAPLFPDVEKNVITIVIHWLHGFTTKRILIIEDVILGPLFRPQAGDWIVYLHDQPIKEDHLYNITFLRELSQSEFLVKATMRAVDELEGLMKTEYLTVNIYNGLINASTLFNESTYQRFLFLTGLTTRFPDVGIGTIFNLHDWTTTHEIVSSVEDELGMMWTSREINTPQWSSSRARILAANGLLAYFFKNGEELELIGFRLSNFSMMTTVSNKLLETSSKKDVVLEVLVTRVSFLELEVSWSFILVTLSLAVFFKNKSKKRRELSNRRVR